jgi:hypothetical protein
MRDVGLYRLLLGIEAPWEVQSVDLSVADQKVDVMVGHAKRVRWPWPRVRHGAVGLRSRRGAGVAPS